MDHLWIQTKSVKTPFLPLKKGSVARLHSHPFRRPDKETFLKVSVFVLNKDTQAGSTVVVEMQSLPYWAGACSQTESSQFKPSQAEPGHVYGKKGRQLIPTTEQGPGSYETKHF